MLQECPDGIVGRHHVHKDEENSEEFIMGQLLESGEKSHSNIE